MEKSHDGDFISITSGKTVTFMSLDSCVSKRAHLVVCFETDQPVFSACSRIPILTHELDYAPSTASLHPINRSTFVTGSIKDGWVRVHDAKTGQEKEIGKGHHGPVSERHLQKLLTLEC